VNPYMKAVQRAASGSIGLLAVDKGPATNVLINAKKSKIF
jgi:hypothetical protein